MSFSIRYVFCFFIVIFFGFVMLQNSVVKAEEGEPWQIRCGDVQGNKVCEMVQRISVAKTGQRIAEFSIAKMDSNGVSRAAIALPLGLAVQEKILMKIDDNKPVSFRIKYCVPAGCISNLSLKEKIINMMKKGSKLSVIAKSADGKPINIVMSLKGFTKKNKDINK